MTSDIKLVSKTLSELFERNKEDIKALREALEHAVVTWKLGEQLTAEHIAWYQRVMDNTTESQAQPKGAK